MTTGSRSRRATMLALGALFAAGVGCVPDLRVLDATAGDARIDALDARPDAPGDARDERDVHADASDIVQRDTPVDSPAMDAQPDVVCPDGFAECDGDLSTLCETDTRTDRNHCGDCVTRCMYSCSAGACQLPRNCLEVHVAEPNATDGPQPIDPDGAGPGPVTEVQCDMSTAGGGWTLIFIQPLDDLSAMNTPYSFDDAALRANASEALIAFRNTSLATEPSWASFAMPATWRIQSPLTIPEEDDAVMVSVGGAAPVAATLRYGYETFASLCDDGWISTGSWGRLCIQGTTAAFYSGFAVAGTDYCTTSEQSYVTAQCSPERRFSIAVR